MKRLIIFLSVILLGLSAEAQYTECVMDSVVFHRNGATISRLSILVPIPQTNQYQTIHNVSFDGGMLCKTDGSQDKYARFQFDNLSADSLTVGVRSVITYHAIDCDFSEVDPNIPYDTTSEEYRLYTGATADGYVDPNNAIIAHIADSIWNISQGIVNYAYNCYLYVAENFEYLNPYTGLHPLSQLLADGGGDCGNLSSIFISLLRSNGVPARHVVSIFSNGDCHVWAEFKMEGFGWIPVDVTYRNSDPQGDYFGKYNYNAVVVGYDVGHTYSRWNTNETYQAGILQNYHWWWWGYGNPTSEWKISSGEIGENAIHAVDANGVNIYQSNGNIIVETAGFTDFQNVSVFDIVGRPIVVEKKLCGSSVVIPVPSGGLYVVTVGRSQAKKLFVLK